MFSSTASKSMTSAAEMYIRNTKPRAEPVKFSPTTKEGIRQVHNVSTKGVKVTKKTLDTVNNVRGRLGIRVNSTLILLAGNRPGRRKGSRQGLRLV